MSIKFNNKRVDSGVITIIVLFTSHVRFYLFILFIYGFICFFCGFFFVIFMPRLNLAIFLLALCWNCKTWSDPGENILWISHLHSNNARYVFVFYGFTDFTYILSYFDSKINFIKIKHFKRYLVKQMKKTVHFGSIAILFEG